MLPEMLWGGMATVNYDTNTLDKKLIVEKN